MMITLLLCLHTINKKTLFTVLMISYFKHLQTLDNSAMWYHVICFPVITHSLLANAKMLTASLKGPFLETPNNYRVWSE